MLEHFRSKKFTAMVVGVVSMLVLALLMKLEAKFGLGFSKDDLQMVAGGIAAAVSAYVLGQSYSEAKTDGATSSVAQAGVQALIAAQGKDAAAIASDPSMAPPSK